MSCYIKFEGQHIPDHPYLKCFCLTFDRRSIKTDKQKEKLFLFNSSITQGRTSNLGFIVFTTLYSHYSYCHQPLGRKLPFLGTYSCVSDTHVPQLKSSQPRSPKIAGSCLLSARVTMNTPDYHLVVYTQKNSESQKNREIQEPFSDIQVLSAIRICLIPRMGAEIVIKNSQNVHQEPVLFLTLYLCKETRKKSMTRTFITETRRMLYDLFVIKASQILNTWMKL